MKGCIRTWLCTSRQGYGRRKIGGVVVLHHRARWIERYGPIPDGLWVLHKCDNKWCVNLRHLYLGTRADNTRDAVARNRYVAAERCPWSKVDWRTVKKIRSMRANGSTYKEIVAAVGVIGKTQVFRITKEQRWKKP